MAWLKKHILPHLAVLLVFLIVTAISVPEAFKGKEIMHGDKLHSLASKRDVQELHLSKGELPNWTDKSYSGMPTTLIYPIYPNNLASTIINGLHYVAKPQVMYLLLPMLSMYLALMLAGYSVWWSLIASLLFGLSTINIGNIDAGHSSKVKAIATSMPLLIGLYLLLKQRFARGFLLLAGFGPLHLATNHLQITYYTMLIGVFVFVILLIYNLKSKQFKHTLKSVFLVVIALVVSILPNTSMLWSNYDYAKESVRGKRILKSDTELNQDVGLDKTYANVFSHSWLELGSLFIPRIIGGSDNETLGSSSNTYKFVKKERVNWKKMDNSGITLPLFWGDKPLNAAPTYIGIVALVLLLFGLASLKRVTVIMFVSAILFTLIVALGSNTGFIADLLFEHLPFYNRFRAPSMILGLFVGLIGWAIAAGLSKLNEEKIKQLFAKRKVKISTGLLATLCLYFLVIGPFMYNFSWDVGQEELGAGKDELFEQQIINLGHSEQVAAELMSAIRSDRASSMRIDSFRALALLCLVIGIFWVYQRKSIRKEFLMIGLIAMIVIDLVSVNKYYLTEDDFSKAKNFTQQSPPSPANIEINKLRKAFDRVVDLNTSIWIDGKPSYYHHNIGGNHAAKLRRYQDLIDNHLNGEIAAIQSGNRQVSVPTLNMLNARFVKTGFEQTSYLENVSALGFAWFVDSIAWAFSPEEEISLIDSLNRSKFAIVSTEFEDKLTSISADSLSFGLIELRSKKPGKVVYRITADKPKLVVFSEIIYKPNAYWKSTIDEVEVDHIRANYALRAIVVPAGQHEVKFEYKAIPFEKGEPISAGGSFLWIISVLIAGVSILREKVLST